VAARESSRAESKFGGLNAAVVTFDQSHVFGVSGARNRS
jgi:hypothetical protein